jgi:AraC family transcriptional regulator
MRRTTLNAHRARIARVVDYIASHLDEPLAPAAGARMSGLSPRQFQRVFTRITGESFKACIRRRRLERAARELQATRRAVLAIALDAGFESHEAFLRAFHRRFGRTPTQFRKLDRRGARAVIRGSAAETWRFVFEAGLRPHVEQAN